MEKTNNKDAILEAAICIFYEKGYAKATLREIAKRCGIAHTAIFNHYGSKIDLGVAALVRYNQSTDALCARILKSSGFDLEPQYSFACYWLTYYYLLKKDPNLRKFMIDVSKEYNNDSFESTTQRSFEHILVDTCGYEYSSPLLERIVDDAILSHLQIAVERLYVEGILGIRETILRFCGLVQFVTKIDLGITEQLLSDVDQGIDWERELDIDVLHDMMLSRLGEDFLREK